MSGSGEDRKSLRQLKRSGAARWSQLRTTLATALKHTSIHFDDISIETLAEMRDLVNDISQQFHEAEAYRAALGDTPAGLNRQGPLSDAG